MKEQTVKNPAMEDMDWAVRHHATVRFNVIACPASVLLGDAKQDGKETTARHPVMVGCGDGLVGRHATARNSVTPSRASVLMVSAKLAGWELNVSKPAMLVCGERAV